MKVITLRQKEFEQACAALARQVSVSGFEYDALVGIATGGAVVARHMPSPLTIEVTRQRPSTRVKKSLAGRMLSRLPRRLNDLLRVAESRLYALLARCRRTDVTAVTLSEETARTLRTLPTRGDRLRILIVDDAIDSGATMLAVVRAIAQAAPEAEIRTAAITQTRSHPLITADYLYFPDRVLVRFPWSADMQK